MESAQEVLVFNEDDRFKPYYIYLSELIYGRNFQSPGGDEILRQIIDSNVDSGDLSFRKGLDVGLGCGGNSFFLYKNFDCAITGIEINDSFIQIATERAKEEMDPRSIEILKKSILDFCESDSYDIAISRDVFMYISDKYHALLNIFNSLRENGKLILIDYCKNENGISAGFEEHVRKGGFDLFSIGEYIRLFDKLGFKKVVVRDITREYVVHMQNALDAFNRDEKATEGFDSKDLAYIQQRSFNKIAFCEEGSMFWVGIYADK